MKGRGQCEGGEGFVFGEAGGGGGGGGRSECRLVRTTGELSGLVVCIDTKQRFNWEEAAELEQEHNTGVHVQK